MNWPWHHHTFDPAKWELEATMSSYNHWSESKLPTKVDRTFTNICLTCGDIVFRKVRL
jgi:hypothetical protein